MTTLKDALRLPVQVRTQDEVDDLVSSPAVQSLEKILGDSEEVLHITRGIHSEKLGVLVATNERMIFVDKGMFEVHILDLKYDEIAAVAFEPKLLFGDILISHEGETTIVTKVSKKHGSRLVLGVQRVIERQDASLARGIPV